MDRKDADKVIDSSQLLSLSELGRLAPPSWLIEGLIEEGAFGVLYGASGEGKSFLALDWAMSIAAGVSWNGRKVKTGSVVYVVAEGGRNVFKRFQAWKQHHSRDDVDQVFVKLQPVQIRTEEGQTNFLAQIEGRNLKPRLIVIDTLARCFLGGEENSAKDMGEFVEGCNRITRATGAAVLVIHHTGKPSGNKATVERGSYALRGAADVMISVCRRGELTKVQVDKQKDDGIGEPISLLLKTITIGADADTGKDITSCVLVKVASEVDDQRRDDAVVAALNASELRLLRVLAAHGHLKSGDWREAIEKVLNETVPQKTYDNWRRALKAGGYVEEVEGSRNVYRVTTTGHATVNANGGPSKLAVSPSRASYATPPLGVADGGRVAPKEDILDVIEALNIPGRRVKLPISSSIEDETEAGRR